MKLSKTLWVLIPAAMLMGCHTPRESDNAHFFTPGEDQVAIQDIADRQAAAQTRADSSLYPVHFAGPNLNSLGKARLDSLMLGYDGAGLTLIYLPETCDTPEHRASITDYLNRRGWKADQFAFVQGPNPASSIWAAKSVSDLDKLNESSGSAENSADNSSSPTGLSASASGK